VSGQERVYDLSTREGWQRRNAEIAARRIPVRYRQATVTCPEVAAWCSEIQQHFALGRPSAAPSLLIIGPTGSGKTHQAYAALRQIGEAGIAESWLAVSVPDLYGLLRPRPGADSEAAYQAWAGAPVLLLDDLGAAKPSDWTEEVNYRLVNHRHDHGLPTIFTSNLPTIAAEGSPSLAAALGERVFSRIAGMCGTPVALKGDDRRREP
jgi:DNA replication protein DnaC